MRQVNLTLMGFRRNIIVDLSTPPTGAEETAKEDKLDRWKCDVSIERK